MEDIERYWEELEKERWLLAEEGVIGKYLYLSPVPIASRPLPTAACSQRSSEKVLPVPRS